jgi:DNA-directed RNA polymerase subunit M/transcription elongation factor TFIIS
MNFCGDCSSILKKTTTPNGIVFICRCGKITNGTPEDTLMFEEHLDSGENMWKHEVFIENSAFDLARNIVLRDCPKCGLNYTTMILIGESEHVMFTCTCGYREDNTGKKPTTASG